MRVLILHIFLAVAMVTAMAQDVHLRDYQDETHDDAYYTYADDVPPFDAKNTYLSTLLFIYHNDVSLTPRTRAKVCKELGYVYYMKHMHESADYYFFKAKKYYEMPALQFNPNRAKDSSKFIAKPALNLPKDQAALEKAFTQTYSNLSKDEILKLTQALDAQIKQITLERDSLLRSGNSTPGEIQAKNNTINSLKTVKKIHQYLIKSLDLESENGTYKKYLLFAGIGLLILLIIIILTLIALAQRKKISDQASRLKLQLIEIARKNTYLEHAARVIRHDMHSGINTYIPRGINSLERKLNDEDIQKLKLESSLKMIKDGAAHAQKVYKNVYEFTNLVKKDVILEKKKCNLKTILESHISSTAYHDQVEIKELVTLDVNEVLFCTAIDNLIKNGLKYNTSEKKWVKVYMEKGNLVIEDNGVGLTAEEFNRLSSKKIEKEDSSKLGINICRAILEEHGFGVAAQQISTGTKITVKIKND